MNVASGSVLKQWTYNGSTNLHWQLVDLGTDSPHRRPVDLGHLVRDRAQELTQRNRVGILADEDPPVPGLAANWDESQRASIEIHEAPSELRKITLGRPSNRTQCDNLEGLMSRRITPIFFESLSVWLSVRISKSSSHVPNPPGKMTRALARYANQNFRMKK